MPEIIVVAVIVVIDVLALGLVPERRRPGSAMAWLLLIFLVPFFGVLLSPVVAAAAMALSSVSVIANSLRLRRLRVEGIER